jgi:hypothetical protein
VLKLIIAVVVAAAMMCSPPACAVSFGSDDLDLGVLDHLHLTIGTNHKQAETCGITFELLSQAIEYPLVGTGLVITSSGDVFLSVSETTLLIANNVCVTAYELEVFTGQRGRISWNKVVLWSASGIYSSAIGDHAQRTRDMYQNQARALVVSWNRARNEAIGSK